MRRGKSAPVVEERVVGFIERIDGAILEGWAYATQGSVLRFALEVDGEAQWFHVQRLPREDVQAVHAGAPVFSGFRLRALDPDAAWRGAALRAALHLGASGQSIPVADALAGALGAADAQAAVQEGAAAIDETGASTSGSAPAPAECAPAEPDDAPDHATLGHWRALRMLNDRLARGGLLAETTRAVAEECGLDAPGRDRLFQSVCPRLCAGGDRAALWALCHPQRLVPSAGVAGVRNAWVGGLALVGLCETGRVLDAIRVLWRLPALLDAADWLPTECLHHAMRRVAAGRRDGTVSAGRARLFVLALLRLAESQAGRWYSRAFDRELIAAVRVALACSEQSGDEALQARSARIAIRVYGLCPAFWEELAATPVLCSPLIERAASHWRWLSGALRAPGGVDGRQGAAVHSALEFFAELRNADVAQFRRELAAGAPAHGIVADGESVVCLPGYLDPEAAPIGAISMLRRRAVPAAGPLVICVVRNERLMVPHFLDHYRGLGVGHFLFVDNRSDDGTRELLLAQPDASVFDAADGYRDAEYGVAWQQAVLASFCRGRWVLLADADEFLVYAGCERRPLGSLIAEAEAAGADAVFTDLVDMYPPARLADADFVRQAPFVAAPCFDRAPLRRWRLGGGRFSSAPSLVSALRHRLVPDAEPNAFLSQKCALFRYQPWVRIGHGVHDVANVNPHAERARFAHFKYHAGFEQKVRAEIQRAQHFAGAREYRHYADMLEGGQGFAREDVSLRYEGSESFLRESRAI